jgi:hypothetical protein
MVIVLIILCIIAYFFFTSGKKSAESSMTPQQKERVAEQEKVEFPKLFLPAIVIFLTAFNIFVYDTGLGIGTGLFNLCLVVALVLSFPAKKRTPLVWILAALSTVAGLGIGYTANGFVQIFNGVVLSLVNFLLVFVRSFDELKWTGLWLFKHVFTVIFRYLKQLFLIFRPAQSAQAAKKISVATVIKTGLITVTVLAVFIGLLSSADPIFAQLIKEIRDQALIRTIVSLIIAVFFSAAVSIKLEKKDDETKFSFFSFQDLLISVGSVVILFAVFLLVQGRYLFGSQEAFQTFGISYSEYVRKGFVELLVTAFLGTVISYILILKQKVLSEDSHKKYLQGINVALLVELFLMLGSAFKRDLMYMDVYGLTRVRMVGGVFLTWLAGFLVLIFLLAVWRKVREAHVFAGVLALSIGAVLFFNGVNIDNIISHSQPGHHNFKDFFYINNLSEDAVEGWKESVPVAQEAFQRLGAKKQLTDIEKAELATNKLAMITIQEQRAKLEKKYAPADYVLNKYYPAGGQFLPSYLKADRKWQAYNYRQNQAYLTLAQNQKLFYDEVDKLISDINEYQKVNGIDLYDQEWRLLHELKYPFVTVALDYYPSRVAPNAPSMPSMYSPYPTWSPLPTPSPVPVR